MFIKFIFELLNLRLDIAKAAPLVIASFAIYLLNFFPLTPKNIEFLLIFF